MTHAVQGLEGIPKFASTQSGIGQKFQSVWKDPIKVEPLCFFDFASRDPGSFPISRRKN